MERVAFLHEVSTARLARTAGREGEHAGHNGDLRGGGDGHIVGACVLHGEEIAKPVAGSRSTGDVLVAVHATRSANRFHLLGHPDDGVEAGVIVDLHRRRLAGSSRGVALHHAEVAAVGLRRYGLRNVEAHFGRLGGGGESELAVLINSPVVVGTSVVEDERLVEGASTLEELGDASGHGVLGVLDHEEVLLTLEVVPPVPVVIGHEELITSGSDNKLGKHQRVNVRDRVDNSSENIHSGRTNEHSDIGLPVVLKGKGPASVGLIHVRNALAEVEHIENDGSDTCNATLRLGEGAVVCTNEPSSGTTLGSTSNAELGDLGEASTSGEGGDGIHGADDGLDHGEIDNPVRTVRVIDDVAPRVGDERVFTTVPLSGILSEAAGLVGNLPEHSSHSASLLGKQGSHEDISVVGRRVLGVIIAATSDVDEGMGTSTNNIRLNDKELVSPDRLASILRSEPLLRGHIDEVTSPALGVVNANTSVEPAVVAIGSIDIVKKGHAVGRNQLAISHDELLVVRTSKSDSFSSSGSCDGERHADHNSDAGDLHHELKSRDSGRQKIGSGIDSLAVVMGRKLPKIFVEI